MRAIGLVILASLLLIPRAASAETADGNGALALAALVGQASPLLGDSAKSLLAKLLDGETKVSLVSPQPLSITADTLICKSSNVDITLHSCERVFGSRTIILKGRAAHELYATLIEVGIEPDGGAGSVREALSKLNCKIDSKVIMENAGGGAHCDYAPAN